MTQGNPRSLDWPARLGLSATLLTLFVLPAAYAIWRRRQLHRDAV